MTVFKIRKFQASTGQIEVEFTGSDEIYNVDVPIENGEFISAEALKDYIQFFAPVQDIARKQALAAITVDSSGIEALVEVHTPADSTGDLSTASLNTLFLQAESFLQNSVGSLPIQEDTLFQRAYAMYREGDTGFWAVGIHWLYAGKLYSAKFVQGEMTDLYEIYESGEYFSSQIDFETLEAIAHYKNNGDTKIDAVTLEVMQESTSVQSFSEIPEDLRHSLIEAGFPHLKNIFYYAYKPYGTTYEFSLDGIF